MSEPILSDRVSGIGSRVSASGYVGYIGYIGYVGTFFHKPIKRLRLLSYMYVFQQIGGFAPDKNIFLPNEPRDSSLNRGLGRPG